MTTIPRACRLIGHPASQLTPPGAGQHGDLRIPEPSSSLIDGQCGVEEPLRKAVRALYGDVDVRAAGARFEPFQNLTAHYLLVQYLTP